MKRKRAIVLLSGGLDSATCLALAQEMGFSCAALSFRYGQRHCAELAAATRVGQTLGITEHRLIDLDLGRLGGSALTDPTLEVPKDRKVGAMGEGIPATYVPARNTIFLAYALGWAEVMPSTDIFIGVNAVDYSGYPDCRPQFIEAFARMANLATRIGNEGQQIRIHTPLILLSKAEIIREGARLGVDYGLTHSCYEPGAAGIACGRCDACVLRRHGFAQAGLVDPLPYAS
jgi:7-cyano-7-deazaguanine synthase